MGRTKQLFQEQREYENEKESAEYWGFPFSLKTSKRCPNCEKDNLEKKENETFSCGTCGQEFILVQNTFKQL